MVQLSTAVAAPSTDGTAEFVSVLAWEPDINANDWLTGRQTVNIRVGFSEHDDIRLRFRGQSGIMSVVSGEGCETLVSAENPYEFAADRLARAVLMARVLQKARRTSMESTEVFLRRTRQTIEYLEEILRLVATVEGMGFEAVITLPPLDG